MKSECIKFHNYAEQIQFSKGVVSTGLKILLIGTEQFKRDILGDKKEIKLTNGKYDICLCEEEKVKELTKYIKRIKNNIYVVSNDEKSELILEYRKPSINESKYDSCENCSNCSNDTELGIDIQDVIEEYSELILSNPKEIHNILNEFYVEIFNSSRFLSKLEQLQILNNEIQEEAEELGINLE